ncbi:biliverdin-producing heme oxygenase [Caulobacter segnis]|uniref:biliverdin-producing heme oxygenase n=1 Tax=Caulobacter segnis TaxID=88688 RepID=UPI002859795C|nr:biliverdin-producing heme oxygenase [Caulobacter segnis]MDR6624909.1 heme oxygenase [Caulobacter segnis]
MLRDRLRAATSKDHAALDAIVSALDFETAFGYAGFLWASAAALIPLELALERAGVEGWLEDWPLRSRRAALALDLADLGVSAPVSKPQPTPTRAFGAGLLYVLEGSRLGARVLAKRVRGAQADLPIAYLTHGGEAHPWRSFLTWLEAEPKVGLRTDEAVAGARYGFQCFSAAFEAVASPGVLNVRAGAHARI